ncbi:MAG: selenocysteine-specific translation elongation factor [Actinomycetota bacterium]
MTPRLTLGTAGHVDHGKTSLVRALTGTDTDRLEEERRRGISIVLGYAELALPDGSRLSVVDVPGHERFVRTMVGGASGVDLALLCVAADDGVMPQTTEHLAILALLGVAHGVVAITKADLADPARLAEVAADVRAALAGTPLADAPVVPVSAAAGTGLEALVAALAEQAARTAPRAATGRVRLPVDRAFALRGIGTVATGTLWSGTLRVGDHVEARPGGATARVRSLEVHGGPVAEAPAGSRVAAALVGVERDDVPPGSVLWTGPPADPSYRLDVEVACLPDAGLAHGEHVEVLHGTALAHARAVVLDADAVPAGGRGLAQLRLDAPLAALRGDRVVLRRLAPPGTVAGGRVLDPAPPRHAGAAADLARLALYAGDDPVAIARAALAGGALNADDLVARGLLEPDAAAAALDAVPGVVALGDWRLGGPAYAAIAAAVTERLSARRAAHPHDPALPVGALLRETPWRDALVERLVTEGRVERAEGGLRLPGAAPAAVPEAARGVVERLAAEPFATHREADLAGALALPADDAWAVLAQLDRDRAIARLPGGLVVDRAAYERAVAIVRERCADGAAITLAELRDATDSSRRVAQALLERMDADRITRRTGDERILRRGASG